MPQWTTPLELFREYGPLIIILSLIVLSIRYDRKYKSQMSRAETFRKGWIAGCDYERQRKL
jgi:hypothetical protein